MGSVVGAWRGVAVAEFPADAEAEVNQGRDADHEANEGVEPFEGDGGEDTEATPVGHAVASYTRDRVTPLIIAR